QLVARPETIAFRHSQLGGLPGKGHLDWDRHVRGRGLSGRTAGAADRRRRQQRDQKYVEVAAHTDFSLDSAVADHTQVSPAREPPSGGLKPWPALRLA